MVMEPKVVGYPRSNSKRRKGQSTPLSTVQSGGLMKECD